MTAATRPAEGGQATGVARGQRATLIGRLGILAVAFGVAVAGSASAQRAPGAGPQSVAPIAEKLIDAVVNISTTQTVKGCLLYTSPSPRD